MSKQPHFEPGDVVVVKRMDRAIGTIWQPATVVTVDAYRIRVVFADGTGLVVEANRGLIKMAPKAPDA